MKWRTWLSPLPTLCAVVSPFAHASDDVPTVLENPVIDQAVGER